MSGNRTTRSQRKSKNVGRKSGYSEIECNRMKPSRSHSYKKGLFTRRKCCLCGKVIGIKKRKPMPVVSYRDNRGMRQKMQVAFSVEGEEQR